MLLLFPLNFHEEPGSKIVFGLVLVSEGSTFDRPRYFALSSMAGQRRGASSHGTLFPP